MAWTNCCFVAFFFLMTSQWPLTCAKTEPALISLVCYHGTPGLDDAILWYRNGQVLQSSNGTNPEDYILNVVASSTASYYFCLVKQNGTIVKSTEVLIQESNMTKNSTCYEPKSSGSGTKYEKNFYFNQIDGQCLPFVYFGTGGNANRFSSKNDCETVCPADPVAYDGPRIYADFELPNTTLTASPTTTIITTTAPESTLITSPSPPTTLSTTTISTTTTRDPTDCSHQPNTEYQFCSFCEKTCDHYGLGDVQCPPVCQEGCFCSYGTLRNASGQCVPQGDCQHVTTQCNDVNAQYYDCAPICHPSCNARMKRLPCVKGCQKGCFCKSGYYFDHSGVCVSGLQCPTDPEEPSKPTCGQVPAVELCKTDEKFYYYDIETESCIEVSNGCTNSTNKFADALSCFTACENACPGNQTKPGCLNDPCAAALSCTGVVNATCIADPCDGCNAYKYVNQSNHAIPREQCGLPTQQGLCRYVSCGHCRKCIVDGHTAKCTADLDARHCQDPCEPNPCKKCETCNKKNVHCFTEPCADFTCTRSNC